MIELSHEADALIGGIRGDRSGKRFGFDNLHLPRWDVELSRESIDISNEKCRLTRINLI